MLPALVRTIGRRSESQTTANPPATAWVYRMRPTHRPLSNTSKSLSPYGPPTRNLDELRGSII